MSNYLQEVFSYLREAVYGTESHYWLGPYDIRVPDHIEYIKASDGGNILSKNGGVTEMFVINPSTKEQYLEKYTVLKNDGFYYWKV